MQELIDRLAQLGVSKKAMQETLGISKKTFYLKYKNDSFTIDEQNALLRKYGCLLPF